MKIVISLIIILYSSVTFANHAAGGYFKYTCLGNDDYLVDFYFLRDCDGIESPPSLIFKLKNKCNIVCGQYAEDAPLLSSTLVDYGCGNDCFNGTTIAPDSYQLSHYQKIIHLPSQCYEWTISTEIQVRNQVSYIHALSPYTYYNYCTINNATSFCNNSVEITGLPLAIACLQSTGTSLYTINNSDGNTIIYSLVSPLVGTCSNNHSVTYEIGANNQMPIPSNNNFQVASDGSISFTPNLIGDSYFALKIEEYNNSTLVGSTVIDGICLSTPSCQIENSFSFSNWLNTNSTYLVTNIVEEEFCSQFSITPNNGSNITNVEIITGAYITNSTINYLPDGTVWVMICAKFPLTDGCNDALIEDIEVRVTGTGVGNCIAQISGEGTEVHHYKITLPPSHYCKNELYFTNRNSISGIPMPIYAEAKQTIWVGNNMPSFYNGFTGIVEINQPTILKAGVAINLPSCAGYNTPHF